MENMITQQHALDAAKVLEGLEYCMDWKNQKPDAVRFATAMADARQFVIDARHPDPELARLREENERLRFPHPRLYETQKQLLDVIAERDQLRARVTTLEQRILDDNKAFGCELRDPNGTIWEHADKLQKENADLRRDREDLDWLEKHFHEVRRQDPGPTMDCEPVRFSVWTPEHGRTNRFTDLRSAVRAARAKDAKTEGQPYDAKAHNSLQP